MTATRYEDEAQQASAAGLALTAGGAWRRAALAWHWGKFVFVTTPRAARGARSLRGGLPARRGDAQPVG